MSEDEILDQVDETGKVIGHAPRSEFHRNPQMIHPVVSGWVFNHKGQVLWQQRSLTKHSAPGKWDVSCGGHVLSGQTPEDTVIYELREELTLEDVSFQFVGKYVERGAQQSELRHVYYAILDVDLTKLKLDKNEVESLKWADLAEAETLIWKVSPSALSYIHRQIALILKYLIISTSECPL